MYNSFYKCPIKIWINWGYRTLDRKLDGFIISQHTKSEKCPKN